VRFLHQLISGQLDMDRMDYLMRDSFYTGVSEGVINTERLLKMLTIAGDDLAIESKGIYSIEKFVVARRLMYWQVYYHKTVLAAEYMLVKALSRAKFLSEQGEKLFATPAFSYFLENRILGNDFRTNPKP
jgi:HD superfamily phosphohydrolase